MSHSFDLQATEIAKKQVMSQFVKAGGDAFVPGTGNKDEIDIDDDDDDDEPTENAEEKLEKAVVQAS